MPSRNPRRRSRVAWHGALCAVSATAMVAAITSPAGANDPIPSVCAEATGRVLDPWGNGVRDVSVDWVSGNSRCVQVVATNEEGRYSTQLRVSTTPSVVKATSVFTSTATQSMQPDIQTTDMSTHDFRLWYLLDSAVASPAYVQPGGAVTLSVRSSAPTPASKVLAQVGTAAAVELTQGATSGPFTSWSTTVYPTGDDGRRSVTFCAVRATFAGTSCTAARDAGMLVSSPSLPTVTFVLDGTAPDTLGGRIHPLSGTQTQFTAQPLSAKVLDPTAGFSASSAVFSLTDTTTGTTTTHRGVSLSGDWVKTAPVSLTPGHVYRVALTVTDRAGNSRTVEQNDLATGGGFRVVNVTAPLGTASANPKACDIGPVDWHAFPPTRDVRCTGLWIHVDSVNVSLSESAHGGDSWLTQTVPLGALRVHATAQGVEVASVAPVVAALKVVQRFRLPDRALGPVTRATEAGTAEVAEFHVRVPATADAAYVELPPTTAQSVATPACADPTASASFCSPDPIPPITSSMPIDDLVVIRGGSVAVSLNGGGVGGVGSLGSSVERETRTREDGTTVSGIAVQPAEAVSADTGAVAQAIKDAAAVPLNGSLCLMQYLRPQVAANNSLLRFVETPGTVDWAACGGGSPYDPPDDQDGGSIENSCWKEYDNGAMTAEPRSSGLPAFKRYYLRGCYTRAKLDMGPRFHYYGDVSRVDGWTCPVATADCEGAPYAEHALRMRILTGAHSYYRRADDANSGGTVYDRHPEDEHNIPETCETRHSTTELGINISKGGVGGSAKWSQSRTWSWCAEKQVPSPDASGIIGVDWRGHAPNGHGRMTALGNGVEIRNEHPSNFTFHMDALVD